MTESYLPVVWKRDTGGSGSRGFLLSLVLWVWKATRAHFTDGKDEDPVDRTFILENYRKKGVRVYSQPCDKIYGIAYIFL